ncbi:MAG: hypothetical protein EOM67_10275, partial [Spirochaetia bacterium]|nr:hypothetical protein [Spirochaetia bacterium]
MKNKSVVYKKKYIHLTLPLIALLALLWLQSATSLYAIAPPVELNLKTVIEPTISFIIDEENITLTLGVDREVNYHLRGNILLKVNISSPNRVGTQFYMAPSTPGVTEKIPYTLKFNYGNGSFVTVNPTLTNNFTNFNATTGYTLDSKMTIITTANDNLPAGTYSDTLTFTV